jgi:hypothetical protein
VDNETFPVGYNNVEYKMWNISNKILQKCNPVFWKYLEGIFSFEILSRDKNDYYILFWLMTFFYWVCHLLWDLLFPLSEAVIDPIRVRPNPRKLISSCLTTFFIKASLTRLSFHTDPVLLMKVTLLTPEDQTWSAVYETPYETPWVLVWDKLF